MISVVCCYNKLEQYNDMLNSLSTQNVDYEIVGIDNRDQKFTSAAAALNWGGGRLMEIYWYSFTRIFSLNAPTV